MGDSVGARTTPDPALHHTGPLQPGTVPHFRVARPSRDLGAAVRFYTKGLGFDILASFSDHAGFDGVIIGHEAWPYHLEFTRRPADPVLPRPTDEDLLVFYLPDPSEWRTAVHNVREHGGRELPSTNPYWNERGIMFQDPDGYLIVLQNAAWP